MRRRLPPPLVVAPILVALSCGGDPWAARGAPTSPPDVQFRTGVEAGDDVYVWNCYHGTRVVIAQSGSACLGTRPPVVYRGACGAPLSVEARWPATRRGGLPELSRWPGSRDGDGGGR